LSKRWI